MRNIVVMRTFSFVVPIYNDGYFIQPFCEALRNEMRHLLGVDDISQHVELIFVNDGSTGESQRQPEIAAGAFTFAKVIQLSRNFGKHVAVSCGYRFASGDYVAMMNVDMQDPPDQIPLLVQRLEHEDCDIVVGLRTSRQDRLVDRVTSVAFNAMLNWLTGSHAPTNAASLRIMSRRFVDAYNLLQEKSPYIPGLESWLGFQHAWVPIRHEPRRFGKSSYTVRTRLRMAVQSILGFSDLPLRFAAGLGLFITLVGALLMIGLVVRQLMFSDMLGGYTSIMAVIISLGGANILFIGLIGLYLGRVLQEVQGRPRFIVQSLHNFNTNAFERRAADEKGVVAEPRHR